MNIWLWTRSSEALNFGLWPRDVETHGPWLQQTTRTEWSRGLVHHSHCQVEQCHRRSTNLWTCPYRLRYPHDRTFCPLSNQSLGRAIDWIAWSNQSLCLAIDWIRLSNQSEQGQCQHTALAHPDNVWNLSDTLDPTLRWASHPVWRSRRKSKRRMGIPTPWSAFHNVDMSTESNADFRSTYATCMQRALKFMVEFWEDFYNV